MSTITDLLALLKPFNPSNDLRHPEEWNKLYEILNAIRWQFSDSDFDQEIFDELIDKMIEGGEATLFRFLELYLEAERILEVKLSHVSSQ